jgi:hypothetical protein
MKTSKEMSGNKSKKASEVGNAVKGKRVTTSKSGPSEEEIRAKASEIYYERLARGEHGTAESDWLEAEELFKGSK